MKKWSWKPSKKALIVMVIFLLFYFPPIFYLVGANLDILVPSVIGGVVGAYLYFWLVWQLLRNLAYLMDKAGMGLIVSITLTVIGTFLIVTLVKVISKGAIGSFMDVYAGVFFILLPGGYLIIIGVNRIRKSWMQRKVRE